MKITVEVDCTPEEARRAMGLPDMAAMQESFATRLIEMGDGAFKPELLETMLRSWSPMGEAGLGVWRALMDAAARPTDAPR